ncbi:MAG: DNA adenine methylase [Bacteroidetes bacterium]|nr:DNA adenine methylase [Bacteroidota bacterium]
MKKKEFHTNLQSVEKPDIKHLNRQIPPEAHTPMYNFHKYWSRKTWNVVGEFIETYCPTDGIVFDPFGGSGVTAIEALKHGRKVIICDLLPIATEITKLTIKPVSLSRLQEAFNRIERDVKNKILGLYKTTCRKCKSELFFDCAVWVDNNCKEIRYKQCPVCGDKRETKAKLLKFDIDLLSKIDNHKIKEWYPKNRLYHISGNPFMKKEKYESIEQLFTKRNLYALSLLMNSIEKENNKEIKDFLKISFTSMVHLGSRMTPVRPTRPFSSAWTQHSYWYAKEFMEQNVWFKFESAFLEKQGLIKAKEESNKYFQNVRFGRKFQDVIDGNADIFIYTGNCINLMNQLKRYYGDVPKIDYIFTDPPYDSSIQYGELSYLWNSWLKKDERILEIIDANEIIHNEKQKKDFEVYASLLKESFRGMFDVLKPGNYLTLTFHSPSFKVRNATIRTGSLSGFDLEKIHHQEIGHPSPKALLQPFGSAQGDFYLRFHKPAYGQKLINPELIDELRFEKIVLDTTIKILADRGEPTPYTIIINAIDPELSKRGYFSELNTGLNVEQVLKKHINKYFILVEGKIGGASGKLWWFINPNQVPLLKTIPLSERVEQTVLRQLQSKGKVSFTDIWEAVSNSFPNSLTSDRSSIRSALEDYARPVSGGNWLIKQNFKPGVIEKEHTTIIALLSEIGLHNGFKIHIGKVEQNHEIDTLYLKKSGKLKQFMNYRILTQLKNIQNSDIVGDIDLLWVKNDKIEYAFEVESTTSMTSALQRGSNIDKFVNKVMLIPVDRKKQLYRKMKSPMFSERFEHDNWSIIYFDVLYSYWNKNKAKLYINDLFNQPSTLKFNSNKHINENQFNMFIE